MSQPIALDLNVQSRIWLWPEDCRTAHAFVDGKSLCGNWLESRDLSTRQSRVAYGVHDRHCRQCERRLSLRVEFQSAALASMRRQLAELCSADSGRSDE